MTSIVHGLIDDELTHLQTTLFLLLECGSKSIPNFRYTLCKRTVTNQEQAGHWSSL